MPLWIAAIILGFVLLVYSSDVFVDGSAALAKLFGVSPLIIGITIVGFGTSAPEILISTFAAWEGVPDLAIGNAIGSNIANIALVLGATCVMATVTIQSRILKLEMPLLLAAMLFGYFIISDGVITRLDAFLLLATLIGILSWLIRDAMGARSGKRDALGVDVAQEIEIKHLSMQQAVVYTLGGLVVLLISSRMLVWGASNVAQALGVSELIIGLTIVAVGTSLPELAASINSARKGEADLAVGNVIGSNLFNILVVMGIPGFFGTTLVPELARSRDYMVMLALTFMMLLFAFRVRGEPASLGKTAGIIFLTAFVGYQLLLFQSVR